MAPVLSDIVLEQAAGAILARYVDSLPRLDKFVVLLPQRHAIPEFIRLLTKHAARDHLVLPRVTTLSDWTSSYLLEQIEISNAKRQSLIYRLLKEKSWFAKNDLWQLSAELLRLFDELTQHSVRLPASEDTFVTQLENIYKIRSNEFLQFEARLIHELWHAMLSDQKEIDPIIAYHKKLKSIAENAVCPLFVIGHDELFPAEQDFFELYSQKQPVQFFPDSENLMPTPISLLLNSVWPERDEMDFPPLRERAIEFARHYPSSPVSSKISFFAAYSLEQEAAAADLIIRCWLYQGKRRIAVIVEDRLVARRARALLERSQILVDDEMGWKLSTTSASTVIVRWLDVVANDFYHQDLLDLLKSPFIFSDLEIGKRKTFIYQLEACVRSRNIVAGIFNYAEAAQEIESFEIFFSRLREAADCFSSKRLHLLHWMQQLMQSLQLLGIVQSLAHDLAGEQLLGLCKTLMLGLESDTTKFNFSEWRSWLNQQLESATFRDRSIESTIIFTHLTAARLRHFDATLIMGADINHLNTVTAAPRFFNQEVRAQLGLPTAQNKLKQLCVDLTGVLLSSDTIYVTWQSTKDGEPNLLSPYFERMRAWHQLAYQNDLLDNDLYPLLSNQSNESIALPGLSQQPQPKVAVDLIPQTISASAYNSLMDCPYQFYARHILGLNQLEEVREEAGKRDYGELIHRILFKFHQRYKKITGHDRAELLSALAQISDKEFADELKLNYLSLSWKLRWEALFEAYLDWQLERENQGWHWYGGEQKYEMEVPLTDGSTVKLKGRIDRIDVKTENNVQQYAVIDYKTQNQKGLKDRLHSIGEDVQLPVYALLFGEAVNEAAYLSIDKDKPALIKLDEDVPGLSQQIKIRLQTLLNQIHQQSAMRAQGVEQICQYCEMRGICRKDYWGGR
jgi:ATP-dependent helicase/nuclease subunit B